MNHPEEKVWRRLALLMIVVAGCAIVAAILYGVLHGATTSESIKDTQTTNTAKADKRDEALTLVKDCVTPGGKCYERSQSQLRGAIASINQYGLALTACADAPGQQTEKELRSCANSAVSRAAQLPTP